MSVGQAQVGFDGFALYALKGSRLPSCVVPVKLQLLPPNETLPLPMMVIPSLPLSVPLRYTVLEMLRLLSWPIVWLPITLTLALMVWSLVL